jgi:hypothetical protein
MTAIATAPDSLGALKTRRDELARLRSRSSPLEEGELAQRQEAAAVRAFTAWFQRQRQDGGIAMPAEGVLDVQPSLSRSFCIGLHDLRYFIGIPKECMSWFLDLPWLQAEVSAESSWLSVRCRRARAAAAPLPAFTLNFDVQPPGYMAGLIHYHYLDVRAIDQMPAEGGAFSISREVYMTLDIRVAQTSGSLRSAYDPHASADGRVRTSR